MCLPMHRLGMRCHANWLSINLSSAHVERNARVLALDLVAAGGLAYLYACMCTILLLMHVM